MRNYHLSMKRHSYTRVLGALGWIESGFCAKSDGKIVIFMVFFALYSVKKLPEALIFLERQ